MICSVLIIQPKYASFESDHIKAEGDADRESLSLHQISVQGKKQTKAPMGLFADELWLT